LHMAESYDSAELNNLFSCLKKNFERVPV